MRMNALWSLHRSRVRNLVLLCLLVSAAEVGADDRDWPFWRGPEYNGISRETGLVDDWNPKGGDGSNVAWARDDLGGRSTPIVMNGKLYTIVRADPGTKTEGEKVVCVDAATGKDVWENRFNVWLSDVPDTRVGWSSCVGDPETGNIYALGVCGLFQCIDGQTGERIWGMPLHEKFGLLSTYGGRTNFPVICDDLVIISAIVIGWGDMAKPAHRFIAFDKRTGEVIWFESTTLLPYDTTYSSPTVTALNGQKAMVFGSGDGGIWALQPRTGLPIWKFYYSRRGINVSPLVVGDTVVASHSEENIEGTAMGSVVALDGSGSGDITDNPPLWREDEMMAGKASPLVVGDRLYLFDDRAKLHVRDLKTGEPVGSKTSLGTVMRSSPLYADGKIYCCTANGRWYILKPDADKGVQKYKKGRLPKGEEMHASPIASHGRVYFQTTGKLYCLVDSTKKPGMTKRPAPPKEDAITDKTPVHLQVIPAEALLKPGDKQPYRCRLFNSRGQSLGETLAEFSVNGGGSISGNTFTVGDAGHQAVTVTAKAKGLTGKARVRIVPPLPWSFDFEKTPIAKTRKTGEPPITWVGARYRHVVRDLGGNKAMVKISTIPKGTRSRCWFGHPELSNYTIEADVKGSIKNDKMPDIGITAQGYTLDLKGADQKLQIRTWVPQERMAQSTPFPWKPDTWYRMKLRAEVVSGKAILKGKAWPRDEKEPSDWTVEATDDAPNRTGSPGLFGNAKDAELFLDNIKVYLN